MFAYLALVSGSVWLGAYIARLLSTYSMFEETELTLKSFIDQANLIVIFNITIPLVNLTFLSYLVMIIATTLFIIFSSIKFKENGWLFITTAIVYLTLPFESMLMILDYKMIMIFINNQFNSELFLRLIVERLTKLSSFPIIQILSYLTIPYLLIKKPFKLKIKNEN
ncbi:MAG: hypothetical protein ACHQLA_00305 [Ignavibacteriales bacterium]